jgi:hypothetical protein
MTNTTAACALSPGSKRFGLVELAGDTPNGGWAKNEKGRSRAEAHYTRMQASHEENHQIRRVDPHFAVLPDRRTGSLHVDAILRQHRAALHTAAAGDKEVGSAFGSTPQPQRNDGHHERCADAQPVGQPEQLQKYSTAEHGKGGPNLTRARHDSPLPPAANVRAVEVVVEEPTLELGPAFAGSPSGEDEKRDGGQDRECDADDTDGKRGQRTRTP